MSGSALARKTIGAAGLTGVGMSASSPVTVVAGGVVATYAATGVVGVPVGFVLLTGALLLLTVGYLALAGRVGQAATFYAVLACVGRPAGVSGAAVAVLAYHAIQISLYGLVGATVADALGGRWWWWAGIVWVVVAVAGVRQLGASTKVIAGVLVGQVLLLVWLVATAVVYPAGGRLTASGFDPSALFVDGVGGVIALTAAAFVGIESPTSYAEEARTPAAIATAVRVGVVAAGLLYAVSAWAIGVAVGPDSVGDPAVAGGLPWSILGDAYGPVVAGLPGLVLVAGIITAMIALHAVAARYVFALGRDRVLPVWLATTSVSGAPIGGSLAQTTVAGIVIVGAAATGLGPMTLFAWLSSLAAFAVIALLTVTSIAAALVGVRERPRGGVWAYGVGPVLGVGAGTVLITVMATNMDSLLGLTPGSPLRLAIPAVVAGTALAGLVWAAVLRYQRPDVYRVIGAGRPDPLAVPDRRLADLSL